VKTRDGDDLEISYSNQVWQCDHTCVDVLLVDQHGELIGRPWLTTVINSYSRCIMGINLGFDAPSSQVVALALRHRMEWQFKSTAGCEMHQLRLLSKCRRCGARFKVPALWEDGCCDSEAQIAVVCLSGRWQSIRKVFCRLTAIAALTLFHQSRINWRFFEDTAYEDSKFHPKVMEEG